VILMLLLFCEMEKGGIKNKIQFWKPFISSILF
jgi:hypothetical protein